MVEQKFKERERTIYLAVINTEIENTLIEWKEHSGFARDSIKLNTLTDIAQKYGCGFVLEISQDAILGGEIPDLSAEAKKHLRQREDATLVFTIPGPDRFRALHEKILRITNSNDYLRIVSDRVEACFDRADILSIQVK